MSTKRLGERRKGVVVLLAAVAAVAVGAIIGISQQSHAAVDTWTAEYFANPTLAGTPVLTREDAAVDFDWGLASPGPGVPVDNFSVRWSRTFAFEAGTWRFTTTTDDGVRLYVDGQLVIDQWVPQSAQHEAEVVLVAGEHTVVMEYFEGSLDALARLTYLRVASEEVPPDKWRGEYFTNTALSGQPAIVRADAAVDFDWGLGAPASGFPVNNFSVRWSRTLAFEAGTWRFTTTTDDGVRLFVDGQLVIDQWVAQSAQWDAEVVLAAGDHTIVMEYFEGSFDAVARLTYLRVASEEVPPDKWRGEYFTNTALSGQPAIVRADAGIDFDWGTGSPASGFPVNNFSVRWSRTLAFEPGTWRFTTTTDDGVRLFVDGQLVIDQWVAQNAQHEAEVALTAGDHAIVMEYFEGGGGAVARLAYLLVDNQGEVPADAWRGEYYTNATLNGAPALVRADDNVDFDWGPAAPASGFPVNNFSVRWSRTLALRAGTYRFTTTTDDGVRLFVDGQLVIDKWIDQGATSFDAELVLVDGDHVVVMEYYDKYGDALARLDVVAVNPSGGGRLPPGFQETVAFEGLELPTVVRFSPDGRVLVGEKSGLIKVFDSLADTTPSILADLTTEVYNYWDRGLLGLALDPGFPAVPYVYVLYSHDAAIGGTAPRWGTPGVASDPCPTPPGPSTDGCVTSARLSRIEVTGSTAVGEQVLVEDWCGQYPSHTIGTVEFGPDGALYASGGDGASFDFIEYGQYGNPPNPCGDPPGGAGTALGPPSAEGGTLRSQDLRTPGDPVSLDGTIIRVDPASGLGLPDNPLAGSGDPNARRVIAYGLRNPSRFTVRPGSGEVWVGDVGWGTWEELNRIPSATDAVAENFGWPCYEGRNAQPGYDAAGLTICENLYAEPGAMTEPFFQYRHGSAVVPGEACSSAGGSSITGLTFSEGGTYPAPFDTALFFADYSRDCVWAMPMSGGAPDPLRRSVFVTGAYNPVFLEIGPGGDLFYVDIEGGTVRWIQYFANNNPPVALAIADPTFGPVPLNVQFDGGGSSDADDDDVLTYAWDLDGDGAYDDSTEETPTYTYTVAGDITVGLEVTDQAGESDTDAIVISPGNSPPAVTMTRPVAGTIWKVGQTIRFSGTAVDDEDGTLPPSALVWTLVLHHCDEGGGCHAHPIQEFAGVSSGTFVTPDHEYPSFIEITLTATDLGGLQNLVVMNLEPRTVTLTLKAKPVGGIVLGFNSDSGPWPLARTVIVGSLNTLSASSPQTVGGATYYFSGWSNGGAQTQVITAPSGAKTYTATFTTTPPAARVARGPPARG